MINFFKNLSGNLKDNEEGEGLKEYINKKESLEKIKNEAYLKLKDFDDFLSSLIGPLLWSIMDVEEKKEFKSMLEEQYKALMEYGTHIKKGCFYEYVKQERQNMRDNLRLVQLVEKASNNITFKQEGT